MPRDTRRNRRLNLLRLESRLTPATMTWIGGAGPNPNAWSNALNWDTLDVPGLNDVARFDASLHAVVVDAPQTVAGVEFTSNWIQFFNLATSLTTTGESKWNGGTVSGMGKWNNSGTVTLNGNAVGLSQATVNNSGKFHHLSANNLNCGDHAVFNNLLGGVYDIASDADIAWTSGLEHYIYNDGTFKKSGGLGDTYVRGQIINTGGVWEGNSGTLHLQPEGDAIFDGAAFHATLGAALDVTGSFTAVWKGTFTGAGAGKVFIDGGAVIVPALADVTLNFPAGLFEWNGGTIAGNKLINASTGFITLNGLSPTLAAANFVNNGTVIHKTGNDLNTGGSNTFTNGPTGVYEFQSDGDVNWTAGPQPTFVNAGLMKKTGGAGVSFVRGTLNNQGGTWDAHTGTLRLHSDGGTHTAGTFKASIGAAIDLTGGSTSFWAGTFGGSGAGAVVVANGSLFATPAGATFNFPAGLFQWNGGVFASNTFTNTGYMTLNGGAVSLFNATLNNSGTITHSSSNNLNLDGVTQIVNEATGLLDFQSDGDVYWNSGVAPTMTNAGVIRKSAGTGTTSIAGNFAQAGGTIDVQTGTLSLPGVPVFSGVLKGHGTLANAVVNTTGQVSPGSSPGALTLGGDYTQSGAGHLRVELAGTTAGTQHDQLIVNGAVALGGTLHVALGYVPAVNDTFVILANDGTLDPVSGAFGNLPTTGSTMVVNGVTLAVDYAGGDGNDVTLKVTSIGIVPPPPTAAIQFNNGDSQRSMVTSMKVTFNQSVVLGANPFQLTRTGSGGATGDVGLAVDLSQSTASNTVAVITFVGPFTGFGSLIDGRYDFRIVSAGVTGLGGAFDGDGNGTGGDDFFEAGSPTSPHKLFRLFGDVNGDGFTDNVDLIQYRLANGSDSTMVNYNAAFDVNGDGFIDNVDFIAFRGRLGMTP